MVTFFKALFSSIIGVLAIIGFMFVWSAEGEVDDSVVIEYPCVDVLMNPEEYPSQVYRECKKLRGAEPQEIKKMKDSI
jgi:hypothetical protein